MQVWFAPDEGDPAVQVEAEEIPFKGYKGFRFFIFKHLERKTWYVCEYITGLVLGRGKRKIDAKTRARDTLKRNVGGDKEKFQEVIAGFEEFN